MSRASSAGCSAGTDYVYPRTTNRILEAYLQAKGVAPEDILINYTPFGHSDWQTIVLRHFRRFGGEGKRTAVVSTINGDAKRALLPRARQPGRGGDRHPQSSPSRWARRKLAGIDTGPLVGHSRGVEQYFMSIDTPEKPRPSSRPGTPSPATRAASPTIRWRPNYIGLQYVGEGGRGRPAPTDADAVIDAMVGRRRAQPHRRPLGDDAQPPHHQSRSSSARDPGRRPVSPSCGRPRPRFRATRGRTISRASEGTLMSDWGRPR